MTFEYGVGLVLSALLTIYLVYALLKPERF
jgi:K+-transporting ATPase KdpF subunit